MKKTIYLFLSFLLFNMLIGASLFAQNGTIGIKQLKVRNAQEKHPKCNKLKNCCEMSYYYSKKK